MSELILNFNSKESKKIKNPKNFLGGKGANLSEMGRMGLPVPPGFTISTKVCEIFYKDKKKLNSKLISQIKKELKIVEKNVSKKLGDLKNPLLIPLEGLFLGIEFIGFENSSNSILENERNNFIKLSFASTKKSSTFYSNKFINNGKWSLLKKNNSVFPFELKSGLSLIFVYK